MATTALPAQDVLHQLLSYDPTTGELLWKERGTEWFNATPARTAEHTAKVWNARYAGQPALNTIDAQGYRHGHLFGHSVKAHRVIWKMRHGTEPPQIDHDDGERSNNRDNTISTRRRTPPIRKTQKCGPITPAAWLVSLGIRMNGQPGNGLPRSRVGTSECSTNSTKRLLLVRPLKSNTGSIGTTAEQHRT